MANFLFLYPNATDKEAQDASPDEMQEVMKSWWDWLGAGQDAGWVIEMGEALMPEGKVVEADHSVTGGPYAESREIVGGFTLVEAADMETACKHARGCPTFAAGGRVEMREVMDTSAPV